MALAVYTDPRFLAAAACRRIRRAMDAGEAEPADVLHDTITTRDDVRRAASIEIDAAVVAEVEARLDARRAAIAAFFDVPLTAREGPGFVRYPEGGFYAPHRDRADLPSWPDAAHRCIAVVIFLNSTFAGGTLRLLEGEAIDLIPGEGTLVAFSASLLHEVTVVRGGTRDVIVDWYYCREEGEGEGVRAGLESRGRM